MWVAEHSLSTSFPQHKTYTIRGNDVTQEQESRDLDYPLIKSREVWEVYIKFDGLMIGNIIRALYLVFPEPGAVLYLNECLEPEEQIVEYVLQRQPEQVMDFGGAIRCVTRTSDEPETECGGGCYVPRLHMIMSKDNLEGLADILNRYKRNVVSVHVHVYKGRTLLMQGYHFPSLPFEFDGDIPEDRIKAFSEAVAGEYQRSQNTVCRDNA